MGLLRARSVVTAEAELLKSAVAMRWSRKRNAEPDAVPPAAAGDDSLRERLDDELRDLD